MARLARFLKQEPDRLDKRPRSVFLQILLIACCTAFGAACGGGIGFLSASLPRNGEVVDAPRPYHVPQYRDGLSFRFVMVHDVIHERFARHGREHYLERNRVTREAIDALPADDPQRWPLYDNMGAGFDRVGRSAEAVEILREKLRIQLDRGVEGRELYTSYANLGTFLIHANFRNAFAGDADAIARFEEGVEFVRASVRVNPEAHFGRERWQAAIGEFLLAAMKSPELLSRFDCIGNRLDLSFSDLAALPADDGAGLRYGSAEKTGYHRILTDVEHRIPELFAQRGLAASPEYWGQLSELREWITRVGAEDGWLDVDVPSHREPAPFDEPMLGIIGMWRQGGGANPHFSLAIAETMLRVGQRFMAWKAFERTKLLADRFTADPGLHEFLRTHCEKRQSEIESVLPEDANVSQLRRQFESELDHGMRFQREYQEFEAAQLEAGVELSDPDLFTQFFADRPPIATAPGAEETFRYQLKNNNDAPRSVLTGAIFGGGLLSLLPLLLSLLRDALRRLIQKIRKHTSVNASHAASSDDTTRAKE